MLSFLHLFPVLFSLPREGHVAIMLNNKMLNDYRLRSGLIPLVILRKIPSAPAWALYRWEQRQLEITWSLSLSGTEVGPAEFPITLPSRRGRTEPASEPHRLHLRGQPPD